MRRSFVQIVCSVVIAVAAVGTLDPAVPEARAALKRVAAEMKYWLNTDSNIRHNSKCKNFNNTKKGRFCGPAEGKACKLCGG